MGISGQTIWRQTGNFLRKQKIIRKITYYESGLRVSGNQSELLEKISAKILTLFVLKSEVCHLASLKIEKTEILIVMNIMLDLLPFI